MQDGGIEGEEVIYLPRLVQPLRQVFTQSHQRLYIQTHVQPRARHASPLRRWLQVQALQAGLA